MHVSCGDGGEEEGTDARHGGHLPHHTHCQQHPLSHVRLPGTADLVLPVGTYLRFTGIYGICFKG